MLGCGGTLSRLIRLQVGSFTLAESVTPDELWAAAERGDLASFVSPPDSACPNLPSIVVDQSRAERARKGQGWLAQAGQADTVRVYDPDGEFIGLARREADRDGVADQTWWRLRLLIQDL